MSKIQEMNSSKMWLELTDDQVTATELADRVAARLEAHPPAELPSFPDYQLQTTAPDFPSDVPYRFGQYYHLQRATALYTQAETGPQLAPSPATRVPLLGRLWGLIRAEAHRLILFYVNRQVSHQARVNRQLVQTLNELTRQVEDQQRTIQRLQEELARISIESTSTMEEDQP